MKNLCFGIRAYLLITFLAIVNSCQGQSQEMSRTKKLDSQFFFSSEALANPQIAEYIRHISEDKNGNFWFGTNGEGAAHYNGEHVVYFSNDEGFAGQQITGISQDPEKNIWFATDQGIVKYDWSETDKGEKVFTNYKEEEVFKGKRFWSVFADSKGIIWAGSSNGVFRLKNTVWEAFDLPFSTKEEKGDFITQRTIMHISEGKNGDIWFGSMGNGAFKYDGKFFTQYTQKDGLTDNSVDHILEDRKGNIWFGTRNGGVSFYDGKTFTNYTEADSIGNNEVCIISEDKLGNIWLSSEGYGVYRFDGKTFTNYSKSEGLGVLAVQAIFEDREGRLWVGGGGGLYRFDGKAFYNVTGKGPWD